MKRRLLLSILALTVTAGLALNSSNGVRNREDQLASIKQQIENEQGRIRILTAEWHTLKAPERIEELSQRHLDGLQPVTPKQVVSLAALQDVSVEEATPVVLATHTIQHPSTAATIATTKPQAVRIEAAKSVTEKSATAKPIATKSTPTPAPTSPAPSLEELIAQANTQEDTPIIRTATRTATRRTGQNGTHRDEIAALINDDQSPMDGIILASTGSTR